MPKYLTVTETAVKIGCSLSTVYSWLAKGIYFKYKKVGSKYMIPEKQVLKFKAEGFPKPKVVVPK